jgi:hypothetical protein
MAYQYISPEVTVNGYIKCCISNAVDGTDAVLWNDSAEGGSVKNEYKEREGTDCEGADSDSDCLVKADRT